MRTITAIAALTGTLMIPVVAKHTPTCQSVDARRKRGQPGLRGLG